MTLRTLLGCHPFPAVFGASSATNCLQASNQLLSGTRFTSLKLRPVVRVASRAHSVWLNVRMSTEASSVPAETFAIGCDFCLLQKLYVPLFQTSEVVLELETGLSSLSYGGGLAASFRTSAIPVISEPLLRHHAIFFFAMLMNVNLFLDP